MKIDQKAINFLHQNLQLLIFSSVAPIFVTKLNVNFSFKNLSLLIASFHRKFLAL